MLYKFMPKTRKISTRRRIWLTFFAILLLTLLAGLIDYPNLPGNFPGHDFFGSFSPRLGLDLQGGTHLIYQADVSQIDSGERDAAMEGVRDVIERRVNAFGVAEPVVQTSSSNRLIVELAGVFDVQEAIKNIGETPFLEFKELNPEATQGVLLTPEEKAAAQDYNKTAKNKAEELLTRVLAGEDFAELAKQFSEDPGSKANGGDLGWAKRGQFVPEFDQAIFDDLAAGQISSQIVETQFGYHIIKKVDERGEGENEEVLASHILIAKKDEETKINSNADQWINTSLSGKQLKKAQVEFDPNTGQPNVSLEFDSEGKDLFAAITKRNLQKPVAIFLDGSPISIPTVQEEILDGKAVISGNFNLTEAKVLAQRLTAGALPVPIELINQQTIGPALGKISLQRSLIAGLLGLLIVSLFMIFYYRLPGLIAVLALIIYTLITLAIFEIGSITLSLAGIAGFILSVGMAVDANILIFERTKEELRNGKPILSSIEEGFNRAWLSIRDSNFSSIITCIILAWFGSSIIKGFAITLAIGILVSMFSAITITRTFLRLISFKYFENHLGWFDVKKEKIEEDKDYV